MKSRPLSKTIISAIASVLTVLLLISCSPQPPAIVPAGGTFATDLRQAASPSYGLIFIVDSNNLDRISGYMVFCGQQGGLSMPSGVVPGLMGSDVELKDGKFTIDNQDVLIHGQLTDNVTMEGTIESKSEGASNCSIPQNEKWIAKCGMPTGLTMLMIGGKSFPEDVLKGSCPPLE